MSLSPPLVRDCPGSSPVGVATPAFVGDLTLNARPTIDFCAIQALKLSVVFRSSRFSIARALNHSSRAGIRLLPSPFRSAAASVALFLIGLVNNELRLALQGTKVLKVNARCVGI